MDTNEMMHPRFMAVIRRTIALWFPDPGTPQRMRMLVDAHLPEVVQALQGGARS
jgi:hypothetical protein